ncbi:polysaccharide biosynthesis tyrosine autokinase [Methylococcus sp. EFPC2]|uniref:polysaccharide biosynthesis tyrosine autokinase n=1 Tax=Methylococcus sp. EFPC2 TaxID=2812648 RepID=UPI0019678F0D|nr:polysaccharide biosynthesis tyrosine autokinase [Methylococcus sp. EFPC2]QSA98579.1 polysaccharide biosynthesis tyrosine autokinase [Methylococcus sp. EFPC2]
MNSPKAISLEPRNSGLLIEHDVIPAQVVRDEPGVSIRDYLDLLWEGRRTLGLAAGTFAGTALLYLLLAPPTYKADALLRIDKNKALLTAPLRSENNKAPAEAENPRAAREAEILRSRSVLGKVVQSLNLSVEAEPVHFPLLGELLARRHDARDGVAGAWWGFGRWAWGGEKLKIGEFVVPDRYYGKEFTLTVLEGQRYELSDPDGETLLEGQLGQAGKAELKNQEPLSIRIDELKARPGERFVLSRQSQLTTIDNLKKAFSVKEASKDTDILNVELKGRDPQQLAQSVNDIANTYVQATVNWESAEAGQKLAFLENQLPVIKDRLEKSEAALSAFREKHGAVDISTEAEVLLKQSAEMETIGIQLKQKFEAQNQYLEGAHPEMIATKAQIARVEKKLADINRRIKDLPHTQQNMVSLSRDVQVNTELYTQLLNSAQEQKVAAAGSIGNSRIVDYAVVPEKPSWPKPFIVLPLAVLLGLTTGAASLFMRNSLRRHENYPALLEYKVGLPLFAAIPHSKTQRRLARSEGGPDSRTAVLATRDGDDISVESLRSLRTTLETTLASHESKVIMISSPAPGMGKSFVTSNLASLLASIKKRVLVIDADLRNGRLNEAYGTERGPGLSELMAGEAALGDVIVTLPHAGVDFIPRGRNITSPAEQLALGDLEHWLDEMKAFYNHILIDSPPILGATDAAIIGKQADATFLVVKEGRYTAQELEVSHRRFRQAGIKVQGFIMNDMKEGSSSYPYYGYAYPKTT